MLNSRSPYGKGYRQPLTKANSAHWENVLESTAKYLLNLKSSSGQLLITHRRKTFILGFIVTIKSTVQIAKKMLTLPHAPFKYVPTYKYSQDHIALLFSCIRAKGGWNNNPNVLQFKSALRRLVLGNTVTASSKANCKALDGSNIIPFFHTRKHATPLNETQNGPNGREQPATMNHNDRLRKLISQVDYHHPSELKSNILSYIAGLVVKKLLRMLKCSVCIESLTAEYHCNTTSNNEHDYNRPPQGRLTALIHFLNRGNLHIPSQLVVAIIHYAEHIFVHALCLK